jgi:hypothetical protein
MVNNFGIAGRIVWTAHAVISLLIKGAVKSITGVREIATRLSSTSDNCPDDPSVVGDGTEEHEAEYERLVHEDVVDAEVVEDYDRKFLRLMGCRNGSPVYGITVGHYFDAGDNIRPILEEVSPEELKKYGL